MKYYKTDIGGREAIGGTEREEGYILSATLPKDEFTGIVRN